MDYYCLICSNNFIPPQEDKIYINIINYIDDSLITMKLCHLCVDDILRKKCDNCNNSVSQPYETLYYNKNNIVKCSNC
jgi:hypothetical protein